MVTLLFLLIGLALVAAQAHASAARPLPTAEAIPVAALGLAWRREKEVTTRHGKRSLWFGIGDPTIFHRAYGLARASLRDAGYSWADGGVDGQPVGLTPCCWEPIPADEAAAETAISAAEAAIVAEDEGIARVQARIRQREIEEAEANGPGRQADLDALRVSLDVLFWAWPKGKKEIADAVLREPMGIAGFPNPSVAQLARQLVRQVDAAIAKVRERLARDPSHDWLARAQEPGVLRAVHTGVQILCSYDEDRASIRNDQGWGKSHSHVGHVLGSLKELSVIEGSQALAAVWRHRKQLRPELRAEIFGSAEA